MDAGVKTSPTNYQGYTAADLACTHSSVNNCHKDNILDKICGCCKKTYLILYSYALRIFDAALCLYLCVCICVFNRGDSAHD